MPHHNHTFVLTLEKRSGERVEQAHIVLLGACHRQTVDEQAIFGRVKVVGIRQDVGNVHKTGVVFESRIAAFEQYGEVCCKVAVGRNVQLTEQRDASADGVAVDG